jgi:NAD(P)-dependent dehydrogenase (short-subunit alcohol dehydrogenase family)
VSTPPAPRRVVLTGASPLAIGIAAGLLDRGAHVAVLAPDASAGVATSVTPVECAFTSEDEIATAVAAAERALGGVDQVVHTWLAPSLVTPHTFTTLDETAWIDGCERSMEAAWWLARLAVAPLTSTRGSLVFVVPTIGMSGGAKFSMLAAAAEGMRVLMKACGRQWGAIGVTANTLAAAPHHWVADAAADALTRSVSLSVPALGGPGDPAGDLAPLIEMLGAPEAHFLTASTVVADGGIWMGL